MTQKGMMVAGIAGAALMALGQTAFLALDQSGSSLKEIEKLEEAYFKKHSTYLQVLPGNKLPGDMEGTVKSRLGKDLPPEYRIDVYGGGKGGQGYKIYWEDEDYFYFKESGGKEIRSEKQEVVSSTTPI